MKVRDLNEELLTELNMTDVRAGVKKVVDGTKEGLKKVSTVLKDEYKDNIAAFNIIKGKFKGVDEVSKDDFKKAIDQLFKDNTKLLIMGAIAALPGSAIALPLALGITKQFGVDLVPTKSFS